MKKKNLIYLFVLLTFGLIITSCEDEHDHEDDNKITITIDEPLNGDVISNCEEVHVHIDIVASVENHEVEIVLHPEGDTDDKIIDFDKHEHDKEITFEQEVDLCSYPAGTCFHLEVLACANHDCDEKETADVEFCLQ